MKILSWNINGIRASKVDLKKLFDSFDADIICLQETKVTRDMLDEPTAIVEGYNAYFSFSRKRSGYSGVATFCKDPATPLKAEEGLAGVHMTKPEGRLGNYGNLSSFTQDELESLDAEGRAVVTQHMVRNKLGGESELAIINVYCPRVDPDREDRHLYKLRFFALLQTRAEALLEQGMHVVVLGDINTTHKAIDHCDPSHEDVMKKPSRIWLNQFLWGRDRDPLLEDISDRTETASVTSHTQGGQFVDTFRHLHPDEQGAYTNWTTLTNARATNYGRRLDYIFADVEIVTKHLDHASVMRDVEGSDHCPVKVGFNVTPVAAKSCPPLCTKFMPEFSGTQRKLSMFFNKITPDSINNPSITSADKLTKEEVVGAGVMSACKDLTFPQKRVLGKSHSVTQASKRLKTDVKKSDSGGMQSSLKTFFSKKASDRHTTSSSVGLAGDGKNSCGVSLSRRDVTTEPATSTYSITGCQKAIDNCNQCCPTSVTETRHSDQGECLLSGNANEKKCAEQCVADTNQGSKAVSAWKTLLGGLGPVPLCKGHKEPCVLRMVKKVGPTKGKQFYTCARGEGLKSNPEARCDFFKWVDKKA